MSETQRNRLSRSRGKKPYTYALKAVDWEERLGLGMETSRGNDWHAGDCGLLARFSDGTVTDSSWSAQSFYRQFAVALAVLPRVG